MTYLIKLIVNNGNLSIYTGVNINGLSSYLEMIGLPTKLNTLGQRSHNFGTSSSINNDTTTPQPDIADVRTRQKSIWYCCGRIGQKADYCIIRVHTFLSPSLRRNTNQLNALHGDELISPPREWNSQLPAAHFKSRIYPPKEPVLWFYLSRGELIIMQLIIVMLRFTLNILQMNLTLNMFQIQKPLQ